MKLYFWLPLLFWLTCPACVEKKPPIKHWHHSANDIRFECKQASETLMAALNQVSQLEASDFEVTVLAIETALAEFTNKVSPLSFYGSVSPDKEKREAAVACEKQTSKLQLEVFAREDLFRVVKRTEADRAALDPLDRRLLDEYLLAFKENGLGLNQTDKAQLESLRKELITLESDFHETLNNWTEVLHFARNELAGLPDDILQRLKPSEQPQKDYVVTLKYPDYYPAMEYVKSAATRRQLYQRFQGRGGLANRERLRKAIELRHDIAKLLGYETYAHFKLENKMAKSPEAVGKFLHKLQVKLQAKSDDETRELLAIKRQEPENAQADHLEPWDIFYYERILKETKYRVDSQLVKTYFPLEKVVAGMFDIYQRLLGVQFMAIKDAPSWHDTVSYFDVIDPRTKRVLASFYMDLFPRDGKFGHAAAFTLTAGYRDPQSGVYEKPVSAIVTNFNPSEDSRPALLSHEEVETLFHEFGHVMHQTLTTAKYALFSGTNVKGDFVEAPSQMLENWVWHKASLDVIASHYETGAKLPDELLQKMLAARNLNQGIRYLKQVFYASIDLAYHLQTGGEVIDTTKLFHDKYEEITRLSADRSTTPEASFGHIMGGYDAGYYGYLWSEVFAEDMFTRFEQGGLFNALMGAEYRKWILEPGGSREPGELIRQFLGREPNPEAFLKQFD